MSSFKGKDQLRGSGSWLIWGIPLILSLCGLVMIASLALRNSMEGGDPYSQVLKQFQFFGLGVTLMFCCALSPLGFVRRWSGLLWGVSVLLVIGTLIPGLSVRVGGGTAMVEFIGDAFSAP